MIVLKLILLLLHFTIVPVAVGSRITCNSHMEVNTNPLVVYIIGFFGNLGIMYVINTLVTFYQDFTQEKQPVSGCFTSIVIVYSFSILLIFFWFINKVVLREDSEFREQIDDVIKRIRLPKDEKEKVERSKFTPVYTAMFFLILLGQLYFAYNYEINQWSYDDYDYVVHSNDNIANNMVDVTHFATGHIPSSTPQRMAASWTTYISFLSVASRIDVASLCHSYLPVILLCIAYIVYFYMARRLFPKSENQIIFMVLVATLLSFGLYSHYSITFRLLCAIWQGKAVLSGIAVPFLMVYMARVLKHDKGELGFWEMVPIFMVSLGICSLTLMSAMLVSIVAVVMWFTICIYSKKLKGITRTAFCLAGPAIQVVIFFTYKIFSAL